MSMGTSKRDLADARFAVTFRLAGAVERAGAYLATGGIAPVALSPAALVEFILYDSQSPGSAIGTGESITLTYSEVEFRGLVGKVQQHVAEATGQTYKRSNAYQLVSRIFGYRHWNILAAEINRLRAGAPSDLRYKQAMQSGQRRSERQDRNMMKGNARHDASAPTEPAHWRGIKRSVDLDLATSTPIDGQAVRVVYRARSDK